jgi:endonuclease YncB( thermonuclease family)
MGADEARMDTKNWLAEQYAETPGMKGTGRTVEHVTERLGQIMDMLPGGELGKELNDRMGGGKKKFDTLIMDELQGHIKKAADLAASEWSPSGKFFSDIGSGIKDIAKGNTRISDITLDSIRSLPESFVGKTFGVNNKLASYAVKAAGRVAGLGMAAIGLGVGLGLGYMVDEPSWKKTTGEILRMTGEEREVLPEGHYKRAGNLSQVTQSFTGPVDQTNPDGIALRAIDESKVDYAVGDGDTIQILSKGFLGMGRKSLGSVRVAGIDTPEVAHAGGGAGGPGDMPFSQPGKNYLTNVLSARTGATVAIGTRETYGRAVGLVTDKEGINYSYQMIQQGLASALYREKRSEDLMNQSAFNSAENVARKSEKGMWAQPFYYGAQANIDPKDRKGWNKMTPDNMAQFHFDKSPGSSQEQSLAQLSEMQHMAPDRAINTIGDAAFTGTTQQMDKAHLQKSTMANMQQMALMGSMRRNRGRGKDRR